VLKLKVCYARTRALAYRALTSVSAVGSEACCARKVDRNLVW